MRWPRLEVVDVKRQTASSAQRFRPSARRASLGPRGEWFLLAGSVTFHCRIGPATHDDQLSRKTCAGSIRDARYAGSQPASAPDAARTAADPASVAGSRGSIP